MTNIAILASGAGTNAENLARHYAASPLGRVTLLLSNRADAGVHARMAPLGIPSVTLANDVWAHDPATVLATLERYGAEFLLLAGFLRCIRPEIIERYAGRILNIHPALLPAYGGKGMYGMHIHRAVVAAGEKQSGVTVHHVTPAIDAGAIVMQESFPLSPDETPESLAAKIATVEMDLYPRAADSVLQTLAGADALL